MFLNKILYILTFIIFFYFSMFFKIFIFWFVRFIYFFMINFSSKECNLVDHSLKHSSCQVINETKPHFSKHHHQIAKIIIHQIHQNLCRLLDYCRTSCFMKVRKFMPSAKPKPPKRLYKFPELSADDVPPRS